MPTAMFICCGSQSSCNSGNKGASIENLSPRMDDGLLMVQWILVAHQLINGFRCVQRLLKRDFLLQTATNGRS